MNYIELEELNKAFLEIKELNYIKRVRGVNDSLETFKVLLRRKSINFENIDIRIKKTNMDYISLFSAIPKGKTNNELKRLKDKYGEYDKVLKTQRVLNTFMQANCNTLTKSDYLFKLDINKEEERIYLVISDKTYLKLEKKTYWDFKNLKIKYNKIPKYLVFIQSWTKKEDYIEYYKYNNIKIYKKRAFNEFINLIDAGIIRIVFHLNIYRTGKRRGIMRDQGTNFEIQEIDIDKLYEKIN